MKIGTTIMEIRKRKKISQGVFSEMIGISQSSLSQIESDKKFPHPATLVKISKVLDTPEVIIYLLSLKDSDVPRNKKEAFNILYPTIKSMFYTIFN